MPYIHWEFAETFTAMTKYAREAKNQPKGTTLSIELDAHKRLMQLYMSPDPSTSQKEWKRRVMTPLQFRRSLDQYHYHALSDTDRRDKDQLMSRIYQRTKESAESGKPKDREMIVVVDQLWLWVLKDSEHAVLRRGSALTTAYTETVFTSFSGRWSKDLPHDVKTDKTDVLENILRDRSRVSTAHDLAGRIIHKCLTSCLDPVANRAKALQFLEFYNTEIGRVARVQMIRRQKKADE